MMIKYKFAIKDVTFQEGYTIVKVNDNLADIDETDPLQVKLALDFGGVEVVEKKETKRGKK